MKVTIKVIQFTAGIAILKSLAATTKLLTTDPSWLMTNGIRNFKFENIFPVSFKASVLFPSVFYSSLVPYSIKAFVVPHMRPTRK